MMIFSSKYFYCYLLLFVSSFLFAQEKEIDIVYTKSGKVKGIIMEEMEGEYIRIMILNGIYVYKILDRDIKIIDYADNRINNNRDVIFTHEGITFRGTIIKHVENEYILIQYKNEILKINLSEFNVTRILSYDTDSKIIKDQKYPKPYMFKDQKRMYISLGYSFLFQLNEEPDFSGYDNNIVVGYQLNRKIGLGLGGGIAYYTEEKDIIFRSLFIEARGYLLEKNWSPYYAMKFGYAIPRATENEIETIIKKNIDLMIEPEIGYRLSLFKDWSITVGIGMKFQKFDYTFDLGTNFLQNDGWYRRSTFNMGILF